MKPPQQEEPSTMSPQLQEEPSAMSPQLQEEPSTMIIPETSKNPYKTSYETYHNHGWENTIPLPIKQKHPVPTGTTGRNQTTPSYPDKHAWSENPEPQNVAIVLPKHCIGLDIDHYEGKRGHDTLTKLEAQHGPLPTTALSTSRNDHKSGIRLFTIPEGIELPGTLGEGIDIIQWSHRYVVASPSIHPTGHTYQWRRSDNYQPIPTPDINPKTTHIPPLPDKWVKALAKPTTPTTPTLDTQHPTQTATEALRSYNEGQPCHHTSNPQQRWTEALTTKNGAAHDTMTSCVYYYTQQGRAGCPGALRALQTTKQLFTETVKARRTPQETQQEWDRSLTGATQRANTQPNGTSCPDDASSIIPPTHTDNPKLANNKTAALNPPTRWDDDTYWNSHPLLAWAHQAARSRLVAPGSVLGAILSRIASETPAWFTIPAMVGSPTHLNFGCVNVGPSGAGKSASVGLVAVNPPPNLLGGWHANDSAAASGEALAASFVHSRNNPKTGRKELHWHNVHTHLYYDEISGLSQASGRQGSTLTSDIRSAMSGQSFGREALSGHGGVRIPSRTVSLGVTISGQPENTGWLLRESDSGTPQRFLWVRSVDPGATTTLPPFPGPPPVSTVMLCPGGCIDETTVPHLPETHADVNFDLPEQVVSAVIERRILNLIGATENTLEGHEILNRIKIACLLAVADGTITVSDRLWEIAGQVMTRSNEVLAYCQTVVDKIENNRNRAIGRSSAIQVEAQADHRLDRGIEAIKRHRGSKHRDGGECPRRCLHQALRRYLDIKDECIDEAEAEGILTTHSRRTPNKKDSKQRYYKWPITQ